MSSNKVIERLKILEENLYILEDFKKNLTWEELKNKRNEWAIRYGLFESIQIIIDISCHLVSKYNLGHPKTYGECIELLKKYDYISEDMAKILLKMIGLRNLLIHEYLKIDFKKLFSFLENIEDFKNFIKAVKPYL
ncbi:MAG: DUF86 domain-containing protein [Caldimicrobium sp.]